MILIRMFYARAESRQNQMLKNPATINATTLTHMGIWIASTAT